MPSNITLGQSKPTGTIKNRIGISIESIGTIKHWLVSRELIKCYLSKIKLAPFRAIDVIQNGISADWRSKNQK